MALLYIWDYLLSNQNIDKEDIDIFFNWYQLDFWISNLLSKFKILIEYTQKSKRILA